MTVPFKELAGSPSETFADGGMSAVRMFLVAWSDRRQFVRELLGSAYGLGGTAAVRYPGTQLVQPVRVDVKAFTDDVTPQVLTDLETGLNAYDSFAEVTAQYQTVADKLPGGETIDLQERTWLSYRASGAAEAVVITGENHEWADGVRTKDPELLLLQRVPIVEHHLDWHNVLDPPLAAIHANVGKVNIAAWHGFAAETMLFDAWSADREFALLEDGTDVVTAWKLSYVFRERRVNIPILQPAGGSITGGWNHYYRTKPQADMGWDVLKDVNGHKPYIGVESTEFDKLFKYIEP